MPDILEAFDVLDSGGAASPRAKIADPPAGGGPLASAVDRLDAVGGRPEWFDERYPLGERVTDFVRANVRAGRPWEEVQDEARSRLGVDPASLEPSFKMESARQRAATKEEPTALKIIDAIPGSGAVAGMLLTREYGKAAKRIAEGKALAKGQDGHAYDDFDLVAEYERLQGIKKDEGFGAALARGVRKLPAIIGEAATGGAVLRGVGLAPRALSGAEAAAQAVTPWTLRATAAAVPGHLARSAAITPLIPSLYLEQSAQNAIANGGNWSDLKNLAPAYTVGVLNAAVLGTLQNVATEVPTRALRLAAKGGVGTTEQAVADIVAGATGLQSGYGAVGDLAQGKYGEAAKHLGVQFITFSALARLHDRPPIDPQFKAAIGELKRAGFEPAEAAQIIADGTAPLTAAIQADPSLTAAKAKEVVKDTPGGPVGDYTRALADTLPESTAGGKRWERFEELRRSGLSPDEAARRAGVEVPEPGKAEVASVGTGAVAKPREPRVGTRPEAGQMSAPGEAGHLSTPESTEPPPPVAPRNPFDAIPTDAVRAVAKRLGYDARGSRENLIEKVGKSPVGRAMLANEVRKRTPEPAQPVQPEPTPESPQDRVQGVEPSGRTETASIPDRPSNDAVAKETDPVWFGGRAAGDRGGGRRLGQGDRRDSVRDGRPPGEGRPGLPLARREGSPDRPGDEQRGLRRQGPVVGPTAGGDGPDGHEERRRVQADRDPRGWTDDRAGGQAGRGSGWTDDRAATAGEAGTTPGERPPAATGSPPDRGSEAG